jgi:Small Multidrug Resistance (SMR) protein
MNAAYYYLAIAICSEVIATVSMKAIKGFSTPIPLLLVIVGYGVAFWMLTLVVRTVPVGVAYGQHRRAVYLRAETGYPGDAGHGPDCAGRGGDSVVLENGRALSVHVRFN